MSSLTLVTCLAVTLSQAPATTEPVADAPVAPPTPSLQPTAVAPASAPAVKSAAQNVRVYRDDRGFKLQVDGRDFPIRGMNWGYTPIGENYRYSLWNQTDDFIQAVLKREMTLLRDMGVNAIRQFDDIPPRWVEYIYKNYGIYTVVNPLMGRYGIFANGVTAPNTDYSNPAHRKALLTDLAQRVERYRDTPGVLMWMLGNENNYGLHWTGYEIQALPGQEDAARAEHLYSLMGEAVRVIKARDTHHPVSIANGDAQYVDLIARLAPELDVFGANVYRGASARDLFDVVLQKLNKPVMFTEFGADAYDAKAGREDHLSQAEYLRKQWEEIYSQSYGHGRAQNALGGFVFQWVDGWWKMGQESNLSVHDATASWPNAGYPSDFVEGQNNMNEEWFGISALGPEDDAGIARVQPRTAYYVLQAAFRLDPYAATTTPDTIRQHFEAIRPPVLSRGYEASVALARAEELSAVRVANLRLVMDSSMSRGSIATTRPNLDTVDHTESIFFDLAMQPTSGVYGRASFNIVGNVARNRLYNLFYENRGTQAAPTTVGSAPPVPGTPPTGASGQPLGLERFALYQAEFKLDREDFNLEGFYRVGHTHWGEEGDFFNLYREAHYGPNIDIYHGNAPFGAVFSGKKALDGFKVAVGPELYWGANPSIVAKYRKGVGPVTLTLVHQEDLARGATQQTASVIRERVARRTALGLEWQRGPMGLELGGIFAAPQRIGEEFTWTRPTSGASYLNSGYEVLRDKVQFLDTLGAKARFTYDLGMVRMFAQASLRGLVADAGPEQRTVLTGWSMRESGRGNHYAGQAGMTFQLGTLQVAPNVLYQKPLIGPNPTINDAFVAETGQYFPGVRPRSVLSDTFSVLDNRETLGAELLLTFDPTPGTWFWSWDRDMREDATFAAGLDLVFRHQPTSRDAGIAILANGSTIAFGKAPPAADEWEATLRMVGNPHKRLKLYGTAMVGNNQSSGEDARQILRYGVDGSVLLDTLMLSAQLRLNDWGPYDYHRVFNLTFPLQATGDLSYGLKRPVLGAVTTRFGVRGIVRMLDQYSEGLSAAALSQGLMGREYEVGAYAILSL
ncbi:MAG TPA: glycoside hydrolase family 2 TIM barrel-domain containing protein [Archangium sp.]|nr:glycoside hydrolase family 2 TIM barrel-domain containing protein [Archangium sp.]